MSSRLLLFAVFDEAVGNLVSKSGIIDEIESIQKETIMTQSGKDLGYCLYKIRKIMKNCCYDSQ
jgi:hypothetical protein